MNEWIINAQEILAQGTEWITKLKVMLKNKYKEMH